MAIIKIDSPEVTIPLSEAIRDNSFKNKFEVFKKIFPSLTKDQLPTVQSISIASIAYRENQGLFQPFSWSSRRQNKFSEAEMENLLETVQVFVNRTNINFTDLFGHVIHREWGLFPGANGELWQKSKTNGVFSAPLSFEEKKDFKLNFRIAVVNPDNLYEVWGLGEELPYQKMREVKNFEQYLTENKNQLQKDMGLLEMPRLLRPAIQIIWNMQAPDGELSSVLEKSDWKSSPRAKSWLAQQEERIKQAHDEVAVWAAIEMINSHQEGGNAIFAQATQHVEVQWDLLDLPPPQTLAEFGKTMEAIKKDKPETFKKIKQSFLETCGTLPFQKRGWAKKAWLSLPSIREEISSLGWLSDDDLLLYAAHEQEAFIKACSSNPVEYAEKLSRPEKEKFLDLLYWNDANFPKSLSDVLNDTVPDIEVSSEPSVRKMTDAKFSNMDWDPLLAAYGIDKETAAVESFEKHPFANWMMRLSPPKDVVTSTRKWLEENEIFNDVNRLILRTKDKEEVNLNTALASKLKDVIETSNLILEESRSSGGFWGRVRKNFSQQETVTSDQWASVYLDFQDHMLEMFEEINVQVERDKLWLSYAEKIKNSADKSEASWQEWLTQNATQIEKEREQNQSPTPEQKMEWNSRVDALESARSAFDHIGTANGISNVLLEKVRQSVGVKERLQQRTTMFYWSSLNLFAGLQSLHRTTSNLGEQAELVSEMGRALDGTINASLRQEMQDKDKIRTAFKNLAQSEEGMKQFYDTLANFQRDTVAIMGEMASSRQEMQEEIAEVNPSMAKEKIEQKRMVMEEPPLKTKSFPGPL